MIKMGCNHTDKDLFRRKGFLSTNIVFTCTECNRVVSIPIDDAYFGETNMSDKIISKLINLAMTFDVESVESFIFGIGVALMHKKGVSLDEMNQRAKAIVEDLE